MKWSASLQDQANVQTLIALYIFMDRDVRAATRAEIERMVSKGGNGPGRVRVAIDELLGLGFIEATKVGNELAFQTASNGVRWMEKNFKISRAGHYEFVSRQRVVDLSNLTRVTESFPAGRLSTTHEINWSKWGTIAAAVALPLSVILWWFS